MLITAHRVRDRAAGEFILVRTMRDALRMMGSSLGAFMLLLAGCAGPRSDARLLAAPDDRLLADVPREELDGEHREFLNRFVCAIPADDGAWVPAFGDESCADGSEDPRISAALAALEDTQPVRLMASGAYNDAFSALATVSGQQAATDAVRTIFWNEQLMGELVLVRFRHHLDGSAPEGVVRTWLEWDDIVELSTPFVWPHHGPDGVLQVHVCGGINGYAGDVEDGTRAEQLGFLVALGYALSPDANRALGDLADDLRRESASVEDARDAIRAYLLSDPGRAIGCHTLQGLRWYTEIGSPTCGAAKSPR